MRLTNTTKYKYIKSNYVNLLNKVLPLSISFVTELEALLQFMPSITKLAFDLNICRLIAFRATEISRIGLITGTLRQSHHRIITIVTLPKMF